MEISTRMLKFDGSVLVPRAGRHQVNIDGVAKHCLSVAVSATIADLSVSGCLISSKLDMPFGMQILVDIPPIGLRAAIVRRAAGDLYGVAFVEQLVQTELRAVIDAGRAQALSTVRWQSGEPSLRRGARALIDALIARFN